MGTDLLWGGGESRSVSMVREGEVGDSVRRRYGMDGGVGKYGCVIACEIKECEYGTEFCLAKATISWFGLA